MFRRILVANRGEIACRVMRTARRMGIETVAVFSDADRDALHVQMADIAVPIGPAPAQDSYLQIDRVVDAALAAGAEAVHPGYGFLSENAGFADACTAAGLVFIGPPASAIRAMGSKSAAKTLMERAGVPLVPGYHGADQDPALLAREAARIGFPVLIKASAGGGGKGMRIVTAPGDFDEALSLARGEARASFNDDRVLVERYLTRPRHVEVQVFADARGETVYLFERDCSVQRRHQKVVEEAPAPGLPARWRAAMGEAAVQAARAVGYVGAGTVEFIIDADLAATDDPAFFFMEMNTRLQVEHPVTEMVTGLDLVEWQLRVATGEPLPLRQDQLRLHGHAIEVRLYAEDPARDFMPATGTLLHLRPPADTPHSRVDTGVCAGDVVTVHYDPMLAKLIVWDHDRPAAVARLRAALAAYEVAGVQTNLELLRRIAADPAFAAAELDTLFLSRHPALMAPSEGAVPTPVLAAAAAELLTPPMPAGPHSPWDARTAWRLNGVGHQDVVLRSRGEAHTVRLQPDGTGGFHAAVGADRVHVLRDGDGSVLDGVRRRMPVIPHGDSLTVVAGTAWTLEVVDSLAAPASTHAAGNRLAAPLPGRVVSVAAAPGQAVTRGQVLVVLEAMKVQMRLTAPADATVAAVHVLAGDLVDEGTDLVEFATPA